MQPVIPIPTRTNVDRRILGWETTTSTKTIKNIHGSVGAEAKDARIELFLFEIKGKYLVEVVASRKEKLASVPSSGGGVVAAAPASGGWCCSCSC
ncbi:60S acidic ribosomal protein p2b-like [Trifolium pratense]|uniref:60S acidic ribosomal protein p2b-like n=1 Tax=Trifolium pratense TaxID=57577 RepID=A0A2K3JYE3_TRIPR|nr:60S acidic ribosomal protein p2b-like [Trifolium pratense]